MRRRAVKSASPPHPRKDAGTAAVDAARGSVRMSNYVYPPREDSELLVRATSRVRGRNVLEIGAGRGVAALAAAGAGAARVVATDRNPHALRELARAAVRSGGRVDAVRTELARGLGRFDVVLANPPYLPTRPEERDPDPWANLALDGGPDGCRVLARLLAQLPTHLTPRGVAYVVVSSLQDRARRGVLLDRWRARGGTARVVDRRRWSGETLWVWRLGLARPSPGARRSARSSRGTPSRRRIRPARRRGSSRAPGPGRTSAPGAASARRRSRRRS